MPLYEYDCPKCGRFEMLQRMSDAPLEKHDCGKRVKKVMSAGSFAFKGSGFYATDYKSAAPACEKANAGCGSCPGNKAA